VGQVMTELSQFFCPPISILLVSVSSLSMLCFVWLSALSLFTLTLCP